MMGYMVYGDIWILQEKTKRTSSEKLAGVKIRKLYYIHVTANGA